jgi:hypothetical protein
LVRGISVIRRGACDTIGSMPLRPQDALRRLILLLAALAPATAARAEPDAPPDPLLAGRGAFPVRVHVYEDYETEIERRWWLRGERVEEDVPPPRSRRVPNRYACRATETKDFDDLQGDPQAQWKAVIFNPVPGPPMGPRTRLSFRYRLDGTDALRVQIYSLTNGYHRQHVLTGLPQGQWQGAVVDMTSLRRPDGTGGPLAEDERIDDIQFYIDPAADLWIDDIVLYEAGADDEPRPFPARPIFTGWFDTGEQGAEWPGDFQIVRHEPPRTWDAARSVREESSGRSWLRIQMRGQRHLARGDGTRLAFRYQLTGPAANGAVPIEAALVDTQQGRTWKARIAQPMRGEWAEADVAFDIDADAPTADELHLRAGTDDVLLVDDLLLYEPGTDDSDPPNPQR